MGYISVFLIAVSLAMDALAVSVTNGICVTDFKRRHALKMGIYFGAFQFFMPVSGYFLGLGFKDLIQAFDHWVAFGLLACIGLNMIFESFQKEEKTKANTASELLSFSRMIMLSVATSIDAFAVGISFAVVKSANIWISSVIIGIVAFVISYCGGILGKSMGKMLQERAQRIGGYILLLIGFKTLFEHIL